MMERVNINIPTSKIPYNTNMIGDNKDSLGAKNLGDKKDTIDDTDYLIDISQNGKARAYSNNYKNAGTTSAREVWEDSARDIKQQKVLTGPYADYMEIMRLDEPETYQKCMDLIAKKIETLTYEVGGLTNYKTVNSWSDLSEEGQKYEREEAEIFSDWSKRYFNKRNNIAKNFSDTFSELENKYSDNVHEVFFNMYGGNNPVAESIWRFNSKFSVMISKNMLDILTGINSEGYDKLLSFIDDSVNNMKMAELKYEGDFEWLRFGVKLQDDWKATYYANFIGCKEPDGIQAESADELLQMLINYKK